MCVSPFQFPDRPQPYLIEVVLDELIQVVRAHPGGQGRFVAHALFHGVVK